MSSQDPAAWLRSHREPSARNLLEVTIRLRSGHAQPNSKDLSGALLEAMRLNNVKQFSEILSLVPDGRLKEDSLTAAWRKARAGILPLNKEMAREAVGAMVQLRYKLSEGARQYASRPLGWGALWSLVDQMLDDSGKLLILLERNPEEADEIVMLAIRSALAIRALKGYFRRSYDEQVPWEEIEYLLALFIEARTCFQTLAFLVTGTDRIKAHLKFFLEEVNELRDKYHGRTDSETAMKEMKQSIGERAQVRAREVVDQRLADITEDFVLLRDWRSLREFVNALKISIDALQLSESDWNVWGWLALQRSLFLAGEKMKNSSVSPNLSSHYVQFVELAVAEGIRKVLCNGIRDTQEHSPPGTNADALTMSVLESKEERQRLGEELKRVLNAVSAMLLEAEYELERKRLHDQDVWQQHRAMAAKVMEGAISASDLIYSEVKRILEDENKTKNLDEITILIHKLSTMASQKNKTVSLYYYLPKFAVSANSTAFNDSLYGSVNQHCPQHLVRVLQLLEWKSAQSLSTYRDDLNSTCNTGRVFSGTASSSALERAVSALRALPDGEQQQHVKAYALEGGLQAVASRWHKDDHAPPLIELYTPSLFGRQLRNHLNHDDLVVRLCFPTSMELSSLWILLRHGTISVSRGAEPRRTSAEQSTGENAALLRLVQLKDDMFRGAREGDLGKVQHAVELGVDISSRDCRGRTLLHAAAEAGQARVVDWLLRLGTGAVDPLARDWEGRSALHNAATKDVAALLFAATGQVKEDMLLLTPLHTAARSGRTGVVQVLIPHFDLNAHDNSFDLTPLHLAALAGDCGTVRLLLLAGARYEVAGDAVTPLCCAAQIGSAPTASLFLQPPPPLLPQPSDADCWAAAGSAGLYRRVEVFSALMAELQRRGAQLVNPKLPHAVQGMALAGSTEVADALLDRWPAAAHLQILPDGKTILFYAAVFGHVDLVRTLLHRGADLLQRCKNSQTALHAAAIFGSVEIIKALKDHTDLLTEESPERKEALDRLWKGDGERVPPLWVAAAVVKHLLEWEVQQLIPHHSRMIKKGMLALWESLTVYRKDCKGRTPLQCCVIGEAPCEVFREVLQYMVDNRVMDLGGKEVLDVLDMVQGALDIVNRVHCHQTTAYGRAPRSDMMKEVLQESLQRLKASMQESA